MVRNWLVEVLLNEYYAILHTERGPHLQQRWIQQLCLQLIAHRKPSQLASPLIFQRAIGQEVLNYLMDCRLRDPQSFRDVLEGVDGLRVGRDCSITGDDDRFSLWQRYIMVLPLHERSDLSPLSCALLRELELLF